MRLRRRTWERTWPGEFRLIELLSVKLINGQEFRVKGDIAELADGLSEAKAARRMLAIKDMAKIGAVVNPDHVAAVFVVPPSQQAAEAAREKEEGMGTG